MIPQARAIRRALAGLVALGCLGAGPADAAFIFHFSEGAGFVTGNGSGWIDTRALTPSGTDIFREGAVNASLGIIAIADGPVRLDQYDGITGPQGFGNAGIHLAQGSVGTGFAFFGAYGRIALPEGYVSRTGLAGGLYFPGESLASLGLMVGTYVYTWGSGDTADSLTVQVTAPTAVVPEPGSLWLILAGLLPLAIAGRRAEMRN